MVCSFALAAIKKIMSIIFLKFQNLDNHQSIEFCLVRVPILLFNQLCLLLLFFIFLLVQIRRTMRDTLKIS